MQETWRGLPQKVGLGEVYDHEDTKTPGDEILKGTPTNTISEEEGDIIEGSDDAEQTATPTETPANYNPKPQYTHGTSKPAGYNFTKMLVIPHTKDEDVNWMHEELPEWPKALYVADDPSAPLHPPKNKGHEVMIYLTWIIDNYSELPDVAVFMHAHRWTWHNNDILDHDALEMLRRLNLNRVVREGYMNVRCHWDPGCPDWMHPGIVEEDMYKQEQALLAKSWSELFPLDPIPEVLAQPCCAQFALSRERIQALPLSRYVFYRDWLLRTDLADYISGRIWEYVWQFVFTGENVFCPSQHVCYCDGYGVCFGSESAFDAWTDKKNVRGGYEGELREWRNKAKAIQDAKEEGRLDEAGNLEVPELGRDVWLAEEIDKLSRELDAEKEQAMENGKDPKFRAEEVGREWKEGDGF